MTEIAEAATLSKNQRDVLWGAMLNDLEGCADSLTFLERSEVDKTGELGETVREQVQAICDLGVVFERIGWTREAEGETYIATDDEPFKRTLQRLRENAEGALEDHAKDKRGPDDQWVVLDSARRDLCTDLLGLTKDDLLAS